MLVQFWRPRWAERYSGGEDCFDVFESLRVSGKHVSDGLEGEGDDLLDVVPLLVSLGS